MIQIPHLQLTQNSADSFSTHDPVMGMLLTHVSSQMGRIFLPCSQMRQPSLAPLKMSDSSSVLSVGMGQGEKSPVDSTPFFLQVEVEF